MSALVRGGLTSYGHVVGILMGDSTTPRIPGDPGHAETFAFPVAYETLEGFPFEDLISLSRDHVDILLAGARALERRGVSLVVTDCGLFAPFHRDLTACLGVPFIGSALDLVPLLQRMLPDSRCVGIITGDTRILGEDHLRASGIEPGSVRMAGMESCPEFIRVVMDRAQDLDVSAMGQGVVRAARELAGPGLGAVVLECTNLISFRTEVQETLRVPVFDLVSLIEFYAGGMMPRRFSSGFIR